MNTLNNYPEFEHEVKTAFKILALKFGLHHHRIASGVHNLTNGRCIIQCTYDRGEVSCSFLNPNSHNNHQFGVYTVFELLYPDTMTKGQSKIYQPTDQQLFDYAELIDQYLSDVVLGDFSWATSYLEKEKHEIELFTYLTNHVKRDHPVFKKFQNNDPSWMTDLEKMISKPDSNCVTN